MEKTEKKCKVCREIRPLTDFTKRSIRKDGHIGTCKYCFSIKYRGKPYKNIKAPENSPYFGCKPEHKKCSNCKEEVHINDYYINNNTPDKLHAWCKNCASLRGGGKPYRGKRGSYPTKSIEKDGQKLCTKCDDFKLIDNFRPYGHGKSKFRRSVCDECETYKRYKDFYGLDKEDFLIMLNKCDSKCNICKEKIEGKALHIDHDHKTGKVRGILCKNCNNGLGMFCDNTSLLKEAVIYLKSNI